MVNHHLKCPMDLLLQMDFQNVKSLVLGLQVLIDQQLAHILHQVQTIQHLHNQHLTFHVMKIHLEQQIHWIFQTMIYHSNGQLIL